ncbi:disease resistance protein RPM1-like isoform X2 [Triticum dicoccoides]|uniref:disease resistance protein RPM1-like isoform X2 n=1 Tax=Triticum dicoccoides TaxID=85692 RepID=UPI000E7B5947|nr:disease resistance protein RPM1-like isoform X2 [Triticum dicoccoides]XP_037423674.1 disease resistance protein RPM1-like isoform X2 [Triticum dicoccoides]
MAGTAVSMARSMLGGAISKAASAAPAEMSLLMGVEKDIWFIKYELESMQAFLLSVEASKMKDIQLKVWAKQVKDLSYNIEDCLSEFMVHVRSQSLSRQLMKLKDRHQIAMQIRELKIRAEELSIRNGRYNFIKTEASNTVDEVDSYNEDVRNHATSNIDEAELVGFSKPKEELTNLIDVNTEDDFPKVICVVGMGGLGKTTIARKTYESKEDIVQKFSCVAWVTVSHSIFKVEMLKGMIGQLLGHEALKKCLKELKGKAVQVDDLSNYLMEELKDKRYFIVFDDLWTIDMWRWIKEFAFPSSNKKGSRIVITTRDMGLAKECSLDSHIYQLKPLQSVDAANLLLRKCRKRQEDMEKDENLKNIVEKLVKKCGGLPLAILMVGGVLATKKVPEWGQFYKHLPSELETNPSLDAMRRMVTLSYNYLPSHLKSCFLYLSIFPEDFEIKRRSLVDRWIAEGFVIARGRVNIEKIGKDYFIELINRSMIIPSRVNVEGTVKSCRVHDVMRDVMISIARDENFVYLSADDNVNSVAEENFRHVSYHGRKCLKECIDWRHVRSLTMFGEKPIEPPAPLFPPSMRMLRTLDVHSAHFGITQKDIKDIGLFRHLKYLNIGSANAHSNICRIPRSIGILEGLQTLEIRMTDISTIPNEICNLVSLRSIRCRKTHWLYYHDLEPSMGCLMDVMYHRMITHNSHEKALKPRMPCFSHWSIYKGVSVPRGISKLQELQILEVVDIKRSDDNAIKELGELVQLKKLGVVTKEATDQKCMLLCAAIEKFTSLCSLNVDAGEEGSLKWLHSVSLPSRLMRSLKLVGCLGEMPNWFGSLMHLVKIYLGHSWLKGGKTMELLGALPILMVLGLGQDTYVGRRLVFGPGAFSNLRILDIYYLSRVREVRFEEGTSHQLERIQISGVWLEFVGIKHLPRLKEISLGLGAKVAKLGALKREVEAHPNDPVLRLSEDWSEHNIEGEADQGWWSMFFRPEEEEIGSESQVVVTATTDVISQGSHLEDDGNGFCSCISPSLIRLCCCTVAPSPLLQFRLTPSLLQMESSFHPEPAAAGDQSLLQTTVMATANTGNIEEDLPYTYNSC